MLGIEKRVKDVLSLPSSQKFSIVCVRTAEPKFLLFGNKSNYPCYVVQFGQRERLDSYFKILTILNDKIPGSVSCPIAIHSLNEHTSMLIISGLSGMPWFNLGAKINTTELWLDLQNRAFVSLRQFQKAVSDIATWQKSIKPDVLLKEMVNGYVKSVATVRSNFTSVVAQNITLMEDVGEIIGFYQHGDFCINNLMISDHKIGIIDLEHFGELAMPLHDEFLLVNSLVENMPVRESELTEDLWNIAFSNSQYTHNIQAEHVSAFYLYHLLWLSIGTFSNPLRLAKNRHYELAIDAFCANYFEGKSWQSTAIWNLPQPSL